MFLHPVKLSFEEVYSYDIEGFNTPNSLFDFTQKYTKASSHLHPMMHILPEMMSFDLISCRWQAKSITFIWPKITCQKLPAWTWG